VKVSLFLVVTAGLLCPPLSARTWEIEGLAGSPCHEEMVAEALSKVGYTGDPGEYTEDERTLRESLPFQYAGFDGNGYALAAIVGARSNDLAPEGYSDMVEWAAHHNDADCQDLHCLRAGWHDGAEGDEDALRACRERIRLETELALGDGELDPNETEMVEVYVAYQGAQEVPLSRFYYHVGRASHVIQDGFSHAYRDPDSERLTVVAVMNWSDHIRGDLVPERDGPAHASGLDDCRCTRAGGEANRAAAVEATSEYLAIVTMDASNQVKLDELELLLDRWFSWKEGCGAAEDYCGSPEWLELDDGVCADSGGGCSCDQPGGRSAGGGLATAASMGAFMLLLLGFGLARHARGQALLLLLLLAAGAGTAGAGEQAAAEGFGGEVRLGFSVNKPAWSAAVAAGYAGRGGEVYLFGEINPYVSVDDGRMDPGSVNIGVGAEARWRVTEALVFRHGLRFGASVLLFDSWGYDAGTGGLVGGLRLLGLEMALKERLFLRVDLLDFTLVLHKVAPMPFPYPQHRFTVALATRF